MINGKKELHSRLYRLKTLIEENKRISKVEYLQLIREFPRFNFKVSVEDFLPIPSTNFNDEIYLDILKIEKNIEMAESNMEKLPKFFSRDHYGELEDDSQRLKNILNALDPFLQSIKEIDIKAFMLVEWSEETNNFTYHENDPIEVLLQREDILLSKVRAISKSKVTVLIELVKDSVPLKTLSRVLSKPEGFITIKDIIGVVKDNKIELMLNNEIKSISEEYDNYDTAIRGYKRRKHFMHELVEANFLNLFKLISNLK